MAIFTAFKITCILTNQVSRDSKKDKSYDTVAGRNSISVDKGSICN